ncbi:hypothetical protein Cgig2_009884 [Carnegiea gigantea]|uniref:Uncharacterized protein n=1 Tax=Carnegiea gigantea TaxID=171969 RepID=A0A9Q1QEN8_9CARY|nr:hypothetical protein Cgig2_009884 [Carnegiea gigantea]
MVIVCHTSTFIPESTQFTNEPSVVSLTSFTLYKSFCTPHQKMKFCEPQLCSSLSLALALALALAGKNRGRAFAIVWSSPCHLSFTLEMFLKWDRVYLIMQNAEICLWHNLDDFDCFTFSLCGYCIFEFFRLALFDIPLDVFIKFLEYPWKTLLQDEGQVLSPVWKCEYNEIPSDDDLNTKAEHFSFHLVGALDVRSQQQMTNPKDKISKSLSPAFLPLASELCLICFRLDAVCSDSVSACLCLVISLFGSSHLVVLMLGFEVLFRYFEFGFVCSVAIAWFFLNFGSVFPYSLSSVSEIWMNSILGCDC